MTGLATTDRIIVVVRNATDRDRLFPRPALFQTVLQLDTDAILEWDGAAWVTTFTGFGALQFKGTGSPEGVVSAGVSSTYQETDGANGIVFWVKTSGTGNTGWEALNVSALARVFRGSGAPNGVVTASVGSLYEQADGTNGAVFWIKATGSGNTGWKRAQFDVEAFNVKDYGAKGDGVVRTNGAVSTGTPDFTSAGAAFTVADVGKRIDIEGAGTAGARLSTTILAYVSATAVTLAANASTTVTAARSVYGTDDTTAAQAALTAAGVAGGKVLFPRGIYLVTGGSLSGKDNVILEGEGGRNSQIVMAGTTDGAIIYASNCNWFIARKLYFYGNNISAADGLSGSAVYWDNNGTVSTLEGFVVSECIFENFKGGGWARVQQTTTTTIQNIFCYKNRFVGGGDRDSTNIGIAAAQFACRSATSGLITDVIVEGNQFNANYVKHGPACISTASSGGFERITYYGNQIKNNGQNTGAGVQGAYGMIVYAGSNGALAKIINIVGNEVDGAYTCGFYGAYCRGLSLANNNIANQVETDDSSLARAGIALTDCAEITIIGGVIKDCQFGVQVSNNTATGSPSQVDCTITGVTVTGGLRGVMLRHSGVVEGYTLTGLTVVGQTTEGIGLWRTASTDPLNGLTVDGCTVIANATPLAAYQGLGGRGLDVYGARWTLTNNSVDCKGAASATAFPLGNVTTAGPSGRFAGNTAYNAGSVGFQLRNARLDLIDNTADTCGTAGNGSSGSFATRDAQGAFRGNRAINIPASTFVIQPSAGEDLGLDTPTWSGTAGVTIENMTASVIGSITAWRCLGTTSWRPVGRIEGPWQSKTTTYTVLDTDEGLFLGGTTWTLTLQAASARTRLLSLRSKASGNITVAAAGADTVEGAASIAMVPNEVVRLMPDGTNWLKV